MDCTSRRIEAHRLQEVAGLHAAVSTFAQCHSGTCHFQARFPRCAQSFTSVLWLVLLPVLSLFILRQFVLAVMLDVRAGGSD